MLQAVGIWGHFFTSFVCRSVKIGSAVFLVITSSFSHFSVRILIVYMRALRSHLRPKSESGVCRFDDAFVHFGSG